MPQPKREDTREARLWSAPGTIPTNTPIVVETPPPTKTHSHMSRSLLTFSLSASNTISSPATCSASPLRSALLTMGASQRSVCRKSSRAKSRKRSATRSVPIPSAASERPASLTTRRSRPQAPAQPWVQHIPQHVAEHVPRQHGDGDECSRGQPQPRRSRQHRTRIG